MGGQQSNVINARKKLDRQESSQSGDSVDISIAEDMLIDILSFVPYRDLLKNCRLVCHEWKDIIDGHSVWLRKCKNEGFTIPKCKRDPLPEHYYLFVYIFEQTRVNFVKNPCGEAELNHWNVVDFGGDGFAIENPPQGSEPVPSAVNSQSCFATSYNECKKLQDIDLYESANSRFLLKNGIVNIKIGEWWAARFDCACVYSLNVYLLDVSGKEIDRYCYKITEQQWNGQEWHLVTHTFTDVSKTRYVRFEHSGSDRQYWAGHYGCKMTGAFVEFQFAM